MMTDSNEKNKFCRLCLNDIIDDNFHLIDSAVKDTLKVILLKLDLGTPTEHVMCTACTIKLYLAVEFKSTCLCTENKIAPYIDSESVLLDLADIYLMEQANRQLKLQNDQKICRLCMQLITAEFVSFDEIDVNLIDDFIPEVNFSVIKNPVVCKTCFDALSSYNDFIKNCVEVEEIIKNKSDDSSSYNLCEPPVDINVKTENLEDCEVDGMEKDEFVDVNRIKFEEK